MPSTGPLGRTLFVHWGQSGGGPRVLEEMLLAFEDRRPGAASVSFNRHAENSHTIVASGIPSISVTTYRSRIGVAFKLPKMVVNSLRVRRFIRKHRVDTVVSTMESVYQSMLFPFLVPRHVRYIFALHDGSFHPGEESVIRRLNRWSELRRADEIITFSTAVADVVRRSVRLEGRSVIASVLPASDTRGHQVVARELPTERAPVLGFFGRLTPYKGLELLSEAAGILLDRGIAVTVRIVGNGELGTKMAAEPSPANVVWDVRWVPESEVVPIVASFDLVALPYTEASQSGVLAQALSLGVPVVATPVGGLSEQVLAAEAGVVASAVEPAAFADAVAGLLASPTTYHAASVASLRSAATAFSWDRFLDDLESIGEAVATTPPTRPESA